MFRIARDYLNRLIFGWVKAVSLVNVFLYLIKMVESQNGEISVTHLK